MHGRVGQALARQAGAVVHGSCRKSDMEQARALGVECVNDYADLDYAVLQRCFDIVVDTSFTVPIRTKLSLLRKGGLIPEIDAAPGKFLRSVFNRKLKIVICKPTSRILSELAGAAAAQRLKTTIGRRAALGDAIDLISEVEHGTRVGGKALVVIS